MMIQTSFPFRFGASLASVSGRSRSLALTLLFLSSPLSRTWKHVRSLAFIHVDVDHHLFFSFFFFHLSSAPFPHQSLPQTRNVKSNKGIFIWHTLVHLWQEETNVWTLARRCRHGSKSNRFDPRCQRSTFHRLIALSQAI